MHKQKLNMGALYTNGSGASWYRNGWSILYFAVVVAILLEWFFANVLKENKAA